MEHVSWSIQSSIYEVNVRQYTPEGTFSAFEKHLPRLQKMGVDILWFMPIQPIGVKHRKGTLGSYYSISDYAAVNAEFGTLADFKRIVERAQALGMKVILDWVANHTAWDHDWVSSHPEWYKKNEKGEIYPLTFYPDGGGAPEYWTDVVGLNYAEKSLWPAMIEAMNFWLRETGIDGFRCDVASLVPTAFWEQAREALERTKPLFMLAESDAVDLHAKAFDATYDWKLYETMKQIAAGQADAQALKTWWMNEQSRYPSDAYRMRYTSNHDINSWHDTDTRLYGLASDICSVLTFTLPSMPLIYGGQEAELDKQMAFFEKDAMDWKDYPREKLYAELLRLKRAHPALGNGQYGGSFEWLESDHPSVLRYRRVKGDDSVTVTANLSGETVQNAGRTMLPWSWQMGETRKS